MGYIVIVTAHLAQSGAMDLDELTYAMNTLLPGLKVLISNPMS